MKRVYVWELPVRAIHWLNFLSIVTLIFTGYYIGAPFIYASADGQLIMATIRFLHFVAAYIFTSCILLRIVLWFTGNKYERFDQFFPASEERRKNLVETLAFYLFMRKTLPRVTGHTAIAGATYLVMFFIFLCTIVTGFALYAESHVGALWTLLGGWLLGIFSSGTIRLVHHLAMWIVIPFAILHVYISVHNDLIEKNGLVMSIFSGYKTEE